MKTCHRCGREGTKGYWTAPMLYPAPNRFFCTNEDACNKRQRAKKVGKGRAA